MRKVVEVRHLCTIFLTAILLLIVAASVGARAPTLQTTSETEPPENELENFDPNNFSHPTTIDNEWLPLQPGTQSVYEGSTEVNDEQASHRLIFTVTDLTKVINGVRTIVVWDQDYAADQLVETELTFFAQDNDGNVWHLGEHPEVYEGGALVESPTWIPGLQGAKAGIMMKANPQLGMPSYAEGWGPAVNWTDRAQVEQMGQQTCVPFNCYNDVLVIKEFNQEEPGAYQLKYYARGVGNIRVGWGGEDAQEEILELTQLIHLSAEDLAQVRAGALELEKHAYEISKDVYSQTSPAEQDTLSVAQAS